MTESELRQSVITIASTYLGTIKGDSKHKELVDYYNNITPKSRNYKVTYKDSYCATACTTWAFKAGLKDIFFPECGVQEMINGFKKMGCWQEDDNYIPNPGDFVTFSWSGPDGDNTGYAQHIALVKKVENNIIHLINPNTDGGQIKETTYKVGYKDIRGFILPDYASKADKIPEVILLGKANSKVIIRCAPKSTAVTCNIDKNDGNGVRHYLFKNEAVSIICKKDNWYQIVVTGEKYIWYPWVNAKYIDIIQADITTATVIKKYKANSKVNVRSSASNLGDANLLKPRKYVLPDQVIEVIGEENGWLHAKFDGYYGYVAAKYFTQQ